MRSQVWLKDMVRKEVLNNFPLSYKDWCKVRKYLSIVKYEKNDTIILHNADAFEDFLFVVKGCVMQYIEGNDGKVIYDFIKEGDFCGDYIALQHTNHLRKYKFQAMDSILAVSIPIWELRQNFAKSEPLIFSILSMTLSERIISRMDQRIYSLVYGKTVQSRYTYMMVEEPAIIQKIPQQYVANYLGVEPGSLSRIKKRYFHNQRCRELELE